MGQLWYPGIYFIVAIIIINGDKKMNPLLGKCPLCILRNEIRSVILLGVLFDTFSN